MLNPRYILYFGLLLTLIPMWGMWMYVQAYFASHDPDEIRFFVDKIAMLGMFSWPLWLGLPMLALLKNRSFSKPEIVVAFAPMVIIIGTYYRVVFGSHG